MRSHRHKTRHETVNVQGLDIFYRHAGDPDMPAILLLHGYPTSSYMYRNLMEPLAETAYVVAPDLPAFGYSSAPSADAYDYTFEKHRRHDRRVPRRACGLGRFFLFIHDFGTPVGYQLATRRPDRIRGLIVQNGNAHDEGTGARHGTPRRRSSPIPARRTRAKLPDWMNFETTRYQYVGEQPRAPGAPLSSRGLAHLDWERLSRPGNTRHPIQDLLRLRVAHRAFPGHPGLPPGAPAAVLPSCFGAGTTPSLISTRSWLTTAPSTRWKSTCSRADTSCWKPITENARL